MHVHPGAEELGRVYHPHLAINASPTGFCAALEDLQPPNEIAWRGADATPRMPIFSPGPKSRRRCPGAVNLGEIMVWLRENLPADAILTNGAGNFAAWVHRFYRFRKFGSPRRRRPRLDGLWPAGGGGDADALSATAPWSALPATATS